MTLVEEQKIITKTSVWTMILNGFLATIKIIAGVIGHSTAIISDSVNSLSDVLTNLVVMVFGRFSRKEKDDSHPYGHEKFDSMVSVFVGVFIIITAFEIGRGAATMLYDYFVNDTEIVKPGYIALIVAVATIIIKEVMYQFTKKSSKKARSQVLEAMAMDNRSDELASLGAVIGIGGAILGWVFLEPVASIVICFFIARVGYRIIRQGVSQVVDQAASEEVLNEIRAIVAENQEIIAIDDLKTRMFGMKLYIDIEIAVAANLSLARAHTISHQLHDEIEKRMPTVKHCMVHVNPFKSTKGA